MKSSNDVWLCDFCGKNQKDIESMVSGPDGVAICDECIELSMEIVTERRREKKGPSVIDVAKGWAAKAMRRR